MSKDIMSQEEFFKKHPEVNSKINPMISNTDNTEWMQELINALKKSLEVANKIRQPKSKEVTVLPERIEVEIYQEFGSSLKHHVKDKGFYHPYRLEVYGKELSEKDFTTTKKSIESVLNSKEDDKKPFPHKGYLTITQYELDNLVKKIVDKEVDTIREEYEHRIKFWQESTNINYENYKRVCYELRELKKQYSQPSLSEIKSSIKPPLGLLPSWLYGEQRYDDVCAAISRYEEAKKEIPIEWLNEKKHLLMALENTEQSKYYHSPLHEKVSTDNTDVACLSLNDLVECYYTWEERKEMLLSKSVEFYENQLKNHNPLYKRFAEKINKKLKQ